MSGSHSNFRPITFLLLSALPITLLAGCRVESRKSASGNGDDVKIATPFGGMSVKTDDSDIAKSTGLPTYPGAVAVKKKNKDDHNDGAADINMSFGNFTLRVKAVSFTTPDPPDQVLAFYKKGLARFGTVIQCKDHTAVGTPTRTPDGLTCSDDEKDSHVHVDDDMSGKMELKAGSKQHQHIVAIDPQDGGTKFGLVALDLPGHFSFGDKDDKDKDSDEGKQ
jgi:hypothetical protein